MSKIKEELFTKIDEFLAERRKSKGGGWAEITDQDMKQFEDILNTLVKLKCEEDADFEYPIQFRLVNRRKRYFPYFVTLPYTHEGGIEAFKDYFNCAMTNAYIANNEVDTTYKLLFQRYEIKEKENGI